MAGMVNFSAGFCYINI